MKPVQKPNLLTNKSVSKASNINVNLHVVSDKERQSARISTYAYLLP